MQIRPNISLAPYTTFQIGGPARLFCSVANEAELVEAVQLAKHNKMPIFVLGKGSNLLVSDAGFAGLVIKNEIKGMEFGPEENGTVVITAGAGENWDDLVDEAVTRNLHGIENLSAIPGTVGAAPVQNIGAYGSEFADSMISVRVFDTKYMKFTEITNANCRFGYRDSIFKHEKGRFVITRVTMKLAKNGATDISYKDLREYFMRVRGEGLGVKGEKKDTSHIPYPIIHNPSIKEVRDAVIHIRLNKLPDWTHWGTAGSFFKNPVISREQFAELSEKYPGIPGFSTGDGQIKVSLGWILENVCNVKGMCIDHVCTYEKQALVIVAHAGATAAAVVGLAQELMKRVKEKTGIEIEGEVEWVC
jgi:UDP-N-acetylmuramate dehydrogenase